MSKVIERVDCLDHGFVELIDVMGDDQAIVEAARTSVSGENVKLTSEDEGLIRYLMRKKHTSPIEMVEFKFRCKMPIFIARQWVRHRTASINEMSGRYGVMPNEVYIPEACDVQFQATNNKQGRSGPVSSHTAERFRNMIEHQCQQAFINYRAALGELSPQKKGQDVPWGWDEEIINELEGVGIARELARIGLPLTLYTQWIWKIDLHNLLHFLRLRLDSHAQYEIRVFGEAMAGMVQKRVPMTWVAFEDYILNAVTLSAPEQKRILTMFQEFSKRMGSGEFARILRLGPDLPTQREEGEWEDKLAAMVGLSSLPAAE